MKPINRIVYATDLSATSASAWAETRRLGQLFNAEVVLFHAVTPPHVIPVEGYIPPHVYEEVMLTVRREAEAELDRALASIAGSGLKVRLRMDDGPPAQRILDVVSQEMPDFLVVGTHGRTGLGRIMLGSVADRVVRQAACPVLTVRPGSDGNAGKPIRRVCYATDLSPTARAAWPYVVAIAEAAKAEVDLVHVTMEPVLDRHLSADTLGRMAELLFEQGRTEVQRFLEGTKFPHDRVHVCLPRGVPSEQIVHRAQERHADLIVMGTHGWSGLVRWMLGSVAQQVIQTAPCPVLTVAPAGAAAVTRLGAHAATAAG